MFLTCCRARPPPITQGLSASPNVKGVIADARGGCASVHALAAPVYRGRARVPHSEAPAVRWRSIERSETTHSASTPGGLPPPSRVCGEGIDCHQSRRSLRAALAQRWCRWESRASLSFATNQSFIIRSRVQVCARCAGERKPLARASLRMAVFDVLLRVPWSRSPRALACARPRRCAVARCRGRAGV